ncbi:MAG: DNA-3-methyladenine glycosylase 2 family protein [Natronomonas sp.]|uniref:DNA-3-methyladenine glycosylase family protein n=1 Tax=Natronomonas sp. TaxID=2184060 RepID=UPI0028700ECD|nr:DNA-3-methyladenine glycosylase 2 family protein [Natronomonas sp.]MDR9382580.1 DNA-3-methyladenine glycosylase 2 family protein [Natronomonas sp.]MDR9431351.1 DNA-3-methyladenine glycosylase 2 family protein [Natronomonas sp.]
MSSPHDALKSDPYIGPLIERYGRLELDPAADMFQRLVVAILRQQVSMAAAEATRERLFEAADVTPADLASADETTLRDCGLSRQKADYVRNVAEAFESTYDRAYFESLDDEVVIDELTTIKGVGEWTARMQLLFSLGRPDVFPVGDLGVRKGMRTLFDDEMSREAMVERAKRWTPYRSYATLYLWRMDEDIAESVTEVDEA